MNLSKSLFERETSSSTKVKHKIFKALECKTATNCSVNVSYHTSQPARSTFVITFSPDRTKVATSHGNHTVKISDCYSYKVLHTLTGHVRTPWCVAFHPRLNSILASGCLGGEVSLWNLKNLQMKNMIYQSQSVIFSLTFHPIDDVLVICSSNKLLFYNWNTRQMLNSINTRNSGETIRLVRFLPNGSKLMTGIANTSKQYCKSQSLNVSKRGDPLSGQGVVETVSCMRIQRRNSESSTNENAPTCSKRLKLDLSTSQTSRGTTTDNENDSTTRDEKHKGVQTEESNNLYKDFVKELQIGNSTKLERANVTLQRQNLRRSTGIQTNFDDIDEENSENRVDCENTENNKERENDGVDRKNIGHEEETQTSETQKGNESEEGEYKKDEFKNNREEGEEKGETSRQHETISEEHTDEEEVEEEEIADEEESENNEENEQEIEIDEDENQTEERTANLPNIVHSLNVPSGRRVRSEVWNFTLGDVTESEERPSTTEAMLHSRDLGISVESSTSSIPVHGFVSFPSTFYSASISDLSDTPAQRAVATATARSSHHVHTAVVIASEEDEQSEVALHTAVNRAIAGAFAGSGEAAVANNIIDTTHRLQLWESNSRQYPDISNKLKNVIVPFCKIHNDASVDVSQDGSMVGVFVPSEYGFPVDAKLEVISIKKENYGQCLYSRKYGPNAVSISLSPLNNYILVGLASRKLHWQITDHQLIGQILKLPEKGGFVFEDKAKPVFSVRHTCNRSLRSNVSVNTIRFHPIAGVGIIYGTNRGHIQHLHIGPSLDLNDPDMLERWNEKYQNR